MSSLTATYGLVASSCIANIVNFRPTACSFGNLTSACSTPVFYRPTLENISTGSSADDRTLTFSTHTDNIACWVTCWSLTLWSVQCSLWSLSLCSVQCSLWSLSLCSLPLLCSGNESPCSSYNFTSKRCSSQSLLPFQHSAVPKILQWKSIATKHQPSWHPSDAFSVQKFQKIFPVTTLSSLYLCRPVNIYIMLYNVPL